jgi:iron complex outermembrane receptor protein
MKISVRHARSGATSIVAAVVGSIIATSAMAQELEEVTVTATRRSENIQDVPIAVTAVTAEQLESKGINDVAKLSAIAPNVTLDAGTPFSGSDTVLAAYIRGIGQNDFAFNQDPGVGVYVDGVYLARSVGSNTSMLDVERVEILRGPQGTLFGRNTIGGAISISARAGTSCVQGSATVGTFKRMDVQATADLPFSDTVRSSLSFSSTQRDGYQRRIPFPITGAVGTEDATRFPASGYQSSSREGGVDQWSTRAKLVIEPNEVFKLTLAGDYQNIDQSSSPNTVLQVDTMAPGGFPFYNLCLLDAFGPSGPGTVCGTRGGLANTPAVYSSLAGLGQHGANPVLYDNRFETGDPDTTYATGNSFSKLKNWGIAATAEFQLADQIALKSITAYRDMHWAAGMDLDGSPLPILHTSFQMPQHELSEELQLNGAALEEKFHYTVGAYYFKEAGHLHDYVTFPGGLLIDGPNDLETKARALYATSTTASQQFGVTVGARYEGKALRGHQNDDNVRVQDHRVLSVQ